MNTRSTSNAQLTPHLSSRTGRVVEEETREAEITDTKTVMDIEVVVGEEAIAGKESGVGEGTNVGSNTGMTETDTGMGGMEVGTSQAIKAPARATTRIIGDHITTATDLHSHLSDMSVFIVF